MLIKLCLLNVKVYHLEQKNLKAEALTSFEIKKRRKWYIRIIQNFNEITIGLQLIGVLGLYCIEKHYIKNGKQFWEAFRPL